MTERGAEDIRGLSREEARELAPGSEHYSAYVGPARQWDFMGATQFRLLTALGLRERHRLLDLGCGGLRAGRLLIPYLDRGHYCGIEPNTWLVEDAIAAEIGQETIERKAPRFSDSASFEAGSFGEAFDFIVAQSVFSHAGPDLLAQALPKLRAALAPGGLMLLTFLRSDLLPTFMVERRGWTYPGCTAYRPETLAAQFAGAGLCGRCLPWYHPRQTWYAVAARVSDLPPPEYDIHLSGAVLRDPEFENSLEPRP